MPLSATEKKYFRGIGHHLRPVVMIAGNGLSESVLAELERALEEHELIKVKVSVGDREARNAAIGELAGRCGCEVVATIGNIALVYRPAKKQNPKLSNVARFSAE